MADENTPNELDPSKNNDEVKSKLIKQGEVTPFANDLDIRHSQSALDDLAAAKTKENEEKPTLEVDETPAPDDEAAKKAADEKAAADKKLAEEAAAKKKQDDDHLKKSEDYFKDTPTLPQGASPKSAEAFAAVKIKAAQEISKVTQERDTFKTENEELKKRLAAQKPLTPEVEKEIEDLRTFRNRLDVEADPKFKEFNKQVSSHQEFIYAQLRKSPVVTDTIIDEIKKHGGPEMVNMSKLFEKVNDPTIQRLVEAKVADIEQVKWSREEAIKSAKTNISQYIAEREKQAESASTAHREVTITELKNIQETVPGLAWLKEQPIDPKWTDEEKKNAEAFNEFRKQTLAQMEASVQDDSAQMRAIQIASVGQLLYVQRLYEHAKGQLEGIEAKHKAATEALTKERDDLKEKLDKIKNASGARMREGGAPPGGKLPAAAQPSLDVRSGDAVDAIAAQVAAERAARGK